MRRKLWSALGVITASLVGIGPSGCDVGVPEYGVPIEDGDSDGWLEGEDCDDADPAVHPEADEICDDGVDNDCDGALDGDDVDCEEPARRRAGLSRVAARALGIWTGDTGTAVSDYSGWGADRDGDGWSADEDPDDHDPTVGGAPSVSPTR